MDHKIKYIHDPKNPRRVATIAYRWVDEDHDLVEYGISVCNPCDHHNKKFGRRIAEGRMINGASNFFYDGSVEVGERERVLSSIAKDVLRKMEDPKIRAKLFHKGLDVPGSLQRMLTHFAYIHCGPFALTEAAE